MQTRWLMEVLRNINTSPQRANLCKEANKIVLENHELAVGKAWQLREAPGQDANGGGCLQLIALHDQSRMRPTRHWTLQMLEVNFNYHQECKRFIWKEKTRDISVAIQKLLAVLTGLAEMKKVSRLQAIQTSGDAPPPLPRNYPSQMDTWKDEPVVVWLVPVWEGDLASRRAAATPGYSRSVRPRQGDSPLPRPPRPPRPPGPGEGLGWSVWPPAAAPTFWWQPSQ
jgi:hypothetical protein